ncbi:hypothetical protein BD626DRAFT_503600 [Schizophyllum amplum]|uniref:RRM domain-containing protein n=1 Tax=Schizophyllum amplum TaxID=97359 RepID=A0A550C7D4_9AGAR|nr:hypothetical protein BD626DRAFT_503600 [Auriculariopsis ampla]
MSTLGKRKERDGGELDGQTDDKGPSKSTLFVSNLPYTATSVDLQTLFSDIAPVRSAFVVTQQGTGVSKGVGYVAYAIKEDAQLAYDKIALEGIKLNSRNLRVEWAGTKKHQEKDKDDTKSSDAVDKPDKPRTRPPKPQHARADQDPNAIRTIVISGLPPSIDQKTLWKKVRKYEGAESVQWPAMVEGKEDKSTGAFINAAKATKAVSKLHAHVFKGSLLSVTLKKRLDSLLAKPVKPGKDQPAAPTHASRLIVRNLPFDITEQDLRAIFLPHGPIHTVTIPEGKKGFAFVWMVSKKDAERAIEQCNGMKVTAGIAEELAMKKQKRKKDIRLEKKSKAAEAPEEDGEEDEDVEMEEENVEADHALSSKKKERVIAVDWALSKDRWEEEKAKLGEDEKSASGSDSDSDSDDEDSDSHLGVHDRDDDESEDDSDADHAEGDEEVPVKPTLPATDIGTTLFVRNVPYDATEDDMRTLFRAFGSLRYARITMDPETGRSRGTGFACFWNKEDADKVIEQSDILRAETTGAQPALKPNPFSMPSLLTPDPSSSLAQSLVLHGRTLDVVRAVTRDTADKLRDEGLKRREKADKRNAYLLREGVILPSSPRPPRSPPRPPRHACVHAFNDEVKAGGRAPLSADELEQRDEHADADAADASAGKKRKFGKPQRVRQTKVIRQAERVDAVTGRARSKGYGFIEMSTHADALRVLRWANNNSELAPLWRTWWLEEVRDLANAERKKPAGERDDTRLKRLNDELQTGSAAQKARGSLIVEFSIENVQVVKRRQERTTAGGKDGVDDKRRKYKSDDSDRPSKRRRTTDEDDTKVRKGGKRDRRDSKSDVKSDPTKSATGDVDDTPRKKARATEGATTPSENTPQKVANPIGSVIGRKRKERKNKGSKA